MTSQFYYSIIVFIFGAVTGSFLNVCICRMPRDESVVSPPSHCPTCMYRIRWYDNIPLASYLLLRGRCRGCGIRIPIRYPLVELGNGLLALALFLRYGPSPTFAALFLFCSALLVITCIDLEYRVIPDKISLPGIVIGFVLSFFLPWPGWLNSLLGILAGGGSLLLVACAYEWLTGREGMGGGDIKLVAMMGAFLGWEAVPFIILAGSLAGLLAGGLMTLIRRQDSRLAIPFGPFLAFGALFHLFLGLRILNRYLA